MWLGPIAKLGSGKIFTMFSCLSVVTLVVVAILSTLPLEAKRAKPGRKANPSLSMDDDTPFLSYLQDGSEVVFYPQWKSVRIRSDGKCEASLSGLVAQKFCGASSGGLVAQKFCGASSGGFVALKTLLMDDDIPFLSYSQDGSEVVVYLQWKPVRVITGGKCGAILGGLVARRALLMDDDISFLSYLQDGSEVVTYLQWGFVRVIADDKCGASLSGLVVQKANQKCCIKAGFTRSHAVDCEFGGRCVTDNVNCDMALGDNMQRPAVNQTFFDLTSNCTLTYKTDEFQTVCCAEKQGQSFDVWYPNQIIIISDKGANYQVARVVQNPHDWKDCNVAEWQLSIKEHTVAKIQTAFTSAVCSVTSVVDFLNDLTVKFAVNDCVQKGSTNVGEPRGAHSTGLEPVIVLIVVAILGLHNPVHAAIIGGFLLCGCASAAPEGAWEKAFFARKMESRRWIQSSFVYLDAACRGLMPLLIITLLGLINLRAASMVVLVFALSYAPVGCGADSVGKMDRIQPLECARLRGHTAVLLDMCHPIESGCDSVVCQLRDRYVQGHIQDLLPFPQGLPCEAYPESCQLLREARTNLISAIRSDTLNDPDQTVLDAIESVRHVLMAWIGFGCSGSVGSFDGYDSLLSLGDRIGLKKIDSDLLWFEVMQLVKAVSENGYVVSENDESGEKKKRASISIRKAAEVMYSIAYQMLLTWEDREDVQTGKCREYVPDLEEKMTLHWFEDHLAREKSRGPPLKARVGHLIVNLVLLYLSLAVLKLFKLKRSCNKSKISQFLLSEDQHWTRLLMCAVLLTYGGMLSSLTSRFDPLPGVFTREDAHVQSFKLFRDTKGLIVAILLLVYAALRVGFVLTRLTSRQKYARPKERPAPGSEASRKEQARIKKILPKIEWRPQIRQRKYRVHKRRKKKIDAMMPPDLTKKVMMTWEKSGRDLGVQTAEVDSLMTSPVPNVMMDCLWSNRFEGKSGKMCRNSEVQATDHYAPRGHLLCSSFSRPAVVTCRRYALQSKAYREDHEVSREGLVDTACGADDGMEIEIQISTSSFDAIHYCQFSSSGNEKACGAKTGASVECQTENPARRRAGLCVYSEYMTSNSETMMTSVLCQTSQVARWADGMRDWQPGRHLVKPPVPRPRPPAPEEIVPERRFRLVREKPKEGLWNRARCYLSRSQSKMKVKRRRRAKKRQRLRSGRSCERKIPERKERKEQEKEQENSVKLVTCWQFLVISLAILLAIEGVHWGLAFIVLPFSQILGLILLMAYGLHSCNAHYLYEEGAYVDVPETESLQSVLIMVGVFILALYMFRIAKWVLFFVMAVGGMDWLARKLVWQYVLANGLGGLISVQSLSSTLDWSVERVLLLSTVVWILSRVSLLVYSVMAYIDRLLVDMMADCRVYLGISLDHWLFDSVTMVWLRRKRYVELFVVDGKYRLHKEGSGYAYIVEEQGSTIVYCCQYCCVCNSFDHATRVRFFSCQPNTDPAGHDQRLGYYAAPQIRHESPEWIKRDQLLEETKRKQSELEAKNAKLKEEVAEAAKSISVVRNISSVAFEVHRLIKLEKELLDRDMENRPRRILENEVREQKLKNDLARAQSQSSIAVVEKTRNPKGLKFICGENEASYVAHVLRSSTAAGRRFGLRGGMVYFYHHGNWALLDPEAPFSELLCAAQNVKDSCDLDALVGDSDLLDSGESQWMVDILKNAREQGIPVVPIIGWNVRMLLNLHTDDPPTENPLFWEAMCDNPDRKDQTTLLYPDYAARMCKALEKLKERPERQYEKVSVGSKNGRHRARAWRKGQQKDGMDGSDEDRYLNHQERRQRNYRAMLAERDRQVPSDDQKKHSPECAQCHRLMQEECQCRNDASESESDLSPPTPTSRQLPNLPQERFEERPVEGAAMNQSNMRPNGSMHQSVNPDYCRANAPPPLRRGWGRGGTMYARSMRPSARNAMLVVCVIALAIAPCISLEADEEMMDIFRSLSNDMQEMNAQLIALREQNGLAIEQIAERQDQVNALLMPDRKIEKMPRPRPLGFVPHVAEAGVIFAEKEDKRYLRGFGVNDLFQISPAEGKDSCPKIVFDLNKQSKLDSILQRELMKGVKLLPPPPDLTVIDEMLDIALSCQRIVDQAIVLLSEAIDPVVEVSLEESKNSGTELVDYADGEENIQDGVCTYEYIRSRVMGLCLLRIPVLNHQRKDLMIPIPPRASEANPPSDEVSNPKIEMEFNSPLFWTIFVRQEDQLSFLSEDHVGIPTRNNVKEVDYEHYDGQGKDPYDALTDMLVLRNVDNYFKVSGVAFAELTDVSLDAPWVRCVLIDSFVDVSGDLLFVELEAPGDKENSTLVVQAIMKISDAKHIHRYAVYDPSVRRSCALLYELCQQFQGSGFWTVFTKVFVLDEDDHEAVYWFLSAEKIKMLFDQEGSVEYYFFVFDGSHCLEMDGACMKNSFTWKFSPVESLKDVPIWIEPWKSLEVNPVCIPPDYRIIRNDETAVDPIMCEFDISDTIRESMGAKFLYALCKDVRDHFLRFVFSAIEKISLDMKVQGRTISSIGVLAGALFYGLFILLMVAKYRGKCVGPMFFEGHWYLHHRYSLSLSILWKRKSAKKKFDKTLSPEYLMADVMVTAANVE